MDAEAVTLRLLMFCPTQGAATADAALRDEILPAICATPGIDDAYVARHGEDPGDRVLATIWREFPAGTAEERVLLRSSLPAESIAIDARRLEVGTLRVTARFERADPPSILRVFRGTVRPGELEAYVNEARTGMLADAAVNAGLVAFYLAEQGPDRFITVSAWTGWQAIEAATGGNIRDPFVTRNTARLTAFTVDHYEVLPDTQRPDAALGVKELLAS